MSLPLCKARDVLRRAREGGYFDAALSRYDVAYREALTLKEKKWATHVANNRVRELAEALFAGVDGYGIIRRLVVSLEMRGQGPCLTVGLRRRP